MSPNLIKINASWLISNDAPDHQQKAKSPELDSWHPLGHEATKKQQEQQSSNYQRSEQSLISQLDVWCV